MTTTRPARSVLRIGATALAAALLGAAVLPTAAQAAPTADVGLFGSADPTYDGVFRESVAVLGLTAVKAAVPPAASAWLGAQQCASGAFQSYRADLTLPCAVADPAIFSGPDSNSTALAAMALRAVGRSAAAQRAVGALTAAQGADGGWGYTLGSASDVNSTGLALAALKGTPAGSADRKAVNRAIGRATSYLVKAQFPCTAAPAARFGLPYQPGQTVDPLASGQALIGIAGPLPYRHIAATGVAGTGCTGVLIQRVSAYLDRLIRTDRGSIPSALDSTQVDWNATATALVALGDAGAAPAAQRIGIAALGAHTADYVTPKGVASPAALGTLIQAAVGCGSNPRSFGTTKANLVSQLLSTVRK
jgi:hypothetical protein